MQQQLQYGSMNISIEIVTPQMAVKWLTKNTSNRRIRPLIVSQYARDMVNSNWHRKPLAICFDATGALANGQHTLSAIIASEVAQELLIAKNVPREAIAIMDIGLRRSFSDVSHFMGSDMSAGASAIVRVLEWGPVGRSAPHSFAEVFEAFQKHQDAVIFVRNAAGAKMVGFNATVLAICARATYTQPHEKITRFLEVIKSGIPNGPNESAAIRIRDICRSTVAGNTGRVDLYRKTESALQYFIKGIPITKVYGSSSELFPIPE